MDVRLRIAGAADAEAIRTLTREAYAKWVPIAGREPLPMQADYHEAVTRHRFDLAYQGDALVALIETAPEGDQLLIVNVAVRPGFQKRGLGVRLLKLAEQLAAEAGLKGTRLYTNKLFAENIRLYESLGYHIESEETLPVGVRVNMAKPASAYLIRPATGADLPLVRSWRERPHVRRWWGDPELEPEAEKLADPRIGLFLAAREGRPFAFIQDYDVHGWTPHHFGHLPPGSRGMDLFIGEPDMLGQGHGSRILRQFVDALFARGVPAAGIDPHPDNAAAIRAFEKAGFRIASGPLETQWSRALLMERRPG